MEPLQIEGIEPPDGEASVDRPDAQGVMEAAGSERVLLERLRKRDGSALGEIAHWYGSRLSRAAFLYLGDYHAAADIVQDTLVAAWEGARRTGDRTKLRPWLFGILFHTCRKHRRSLSRLRRREEVSASRRANSTDEKTEEDRTDRIARLREILPKLADDLRAVVVLRYEQGMSVADTAEALGIPEGTVKSRCHAAIRQLRTELDREP